MTYSIVDNNFLDNYNYNNYTINIENSIKIIYYDKSEKIDNLLNYGIIKQNNNYYLNLYNKFNIIDINIIKNIMPIDIDYIFVNNLNNEIYISNYGYILEFKINDN